MNTSKTADNITIPSAGLLEQIVTASNLLDTSSRDQLPLQRHTYSSEDDSEEEVFEDGDNEDGGNEKGRGHGVDESIYKGNGNGNEENEQSGLAAVLTELSQATSNSSHSISNPPRQPNSANVNMTAAINSINSLLQSHLNPSPPQHPHKVRLSGPIRANINIRHGVWAPRLRCRKRKNLHAKDGIWIHSTCTLDHLVALVRSVLPDEFDWDPVSSPLRYQAVNDQSLQSLKTVSGTVVSGQSLFAAFDLVRNRRSDGDNFILQLYVYGTWTVLLKPNYANSNTTNSNTGSHQIMMHHGHIDEDLSSIQPPPKKKYQQAHYNQQQQQQQLQQVEISSDSSNSNNNNNNLFNGQVFMRSSAANPPHNVQHSTQSQSYHSQVQTQVPQVPQVPQVYSHPLAANPPVTFLPTVTLEMKLNGTFIPVEISRRSFIAAFRACSLPKTQSSSAVPSSVNVKDESGHSISINSSSSNGNISSNCHNITSSSSSNSNGNNVISNDSSISTSSSSSSLQSLTTPPPSNP